MVFELTLISVLLKYVLTEFVIFSQTYKVNNGQPGMDEEN